MNKATATLYFDTRRSDDNTGFLRLRIYFERNQKVYATGEKITADEWKFLDRVKATLPGTVKSEERRNLWQRVYGQFTDKSGKVQDGCFVRAQTIVDLLGDSFTFDAFADELANYGKAKEAPADQTGVVQAL